MSYIVGLSSLLRSFLNSRDDHVGRISFGLHLRRTEKRRRMEREREKGSYFEDIAFLCTLIEETDHLIDRLNDLGGRQLLNDIFEIQRVTEQNSDQLVRLERQRRDEEERERERESWLLHRWSWPRLLVEAFERCVAASSNREDVSLFDAILAIEPSSLGV